MATGKMLPSKPHFFQPLLPGFKQGLSIPVSFFKHLKGQECDKAVFRSSGGKVWHVKINGRRFEGGWEEFAQEHDLHVGDLLVFRHEGNMVFDFMVFDPSECEREYPLFHVKQEIQTSEEEEDQLPNKSSPGEVTKKKKKKVELSSKGKTAASSYFVVNVTSYSIRSSRLNLSREFARTNGLCNRRCKIVLKNLEGRPWVADLGFKKSSNLVYISQGLRSFYTANNLEPGDSFIFELIENWKKPVLKMRELTRKKQVKTESGDKAISSCFVVNMTAYSARRPRINIPRKFARSNGLNKRFGKIVLMDEEGRSWPANLGQKNDGQAYIGQGWTAFRNANKLKPGDSFMFELTKKGKKPLLIMRWKTNTKTKSERWTDAPFFYAMFRASSLESYWLKFPRDFVNKNDIISKCSKMILTNEGGRSWTVSVGRNNSGEVSLRSGWNVFAQANGLKEGDVFMLELIKKGKSPAMKFYGAKLQNGIA